MKFKPDKFQKRAIKKIITQPAAAILNDPGTGKTGAVLAAMDILKDTGIVKKILVVASIRIIYSVWPQEIEKWGYDFKIAMLHGNKKDEALKSKSDFHLMNYEGIPWLYKQPKKLREQFDVVIFDESTKLKNNSSVRFKRLKKMLGGFARRYIMTGTIIPNGYEDLYSQIFILDAGESLGRFKTHYLNEYFHVYKVTTAKVSFPIKTLREGADKEITKKIKHLVTRCNSDHLKLPKLYHNAIIVDWPNVKVKKQYRDMEAWLCTEVKKGTVVLAQNGGVATMKLRQMCNGHIFDNNKETHFIHDAKIEALRELLEELQGNPLFVGYEFKSDLKMIMDAFPYLNIGGKKIKTKAISAGINPYDQLRIQKEWNAGKLPLLVASIPVASHGLNLQDYGHHLCYYSQTWNAEDDYQFIKRLYRRGQKKSVYVHRLIMEDSVDLTVMEKVDGKKATQSDLLKRLEKRYK